MDTMTKELNQNLGSESGTFLVKATWIYDMTVPLRLVKTDQLCFEPEPLSNQVNFRLGDQEILFQLKYPKLYSMLDDFQKAKMSEFFENGEIK